MQLPPDSVKCPATGFQRSCRSIVAECDCPKFVSIKGADPQGGTLDRAGCIDAMLPHLLLEIAQQARQAGAAVENLRNEMVRVEEGKREALLTFAARGGPVLVPLNKS